MSQLVYDRAVVFQKKQHAAYYRRAYNPIEFIQKDRSKHDSFYGESASEAPLSLPRILIPAQRTINPSKQAIKKLGVQDARDLAVYFSIGLLEEGTRQEDGTRIPFPRPRVGDFVIVKGALFEISDVVEADFFGQTEVPLTLVAMCVKRPVGYPAPPFQIQMDFKPMPVSETYRDYLDDEDKEALGEPPLVLMPKAP